MIGSCKCKNLIIDWKIRDLSLIPRACQCDYCRESKIQWVSKSGSNFSLTVRYSNKYQVDKNGTSLASFHKCLNCQEVVAISSTINNKNYGAINVQCLSQSNRFPCAKKVTPEKNLTGKSRQNMWQQNWCYPVEIITTKRSPKLFVVK